MPIRLLPLGTIEQLAVLKKPVHAVKDSQKTVADSVRRIARVVGEGGVVQAEAAEAMLRDERGLYQGRAAMVIRPGTSQECAEVVEICAGAGIGIVPQGGNTGYCGGATPFDGDRQILLSLSRMNRIREVDPVNRTMTVEAGSVLSRAHAAAEEHGLMFPLSMGSEGSCQIGGVLSTNAGGVAVLKYGNARDLVLGIEAVLPSGEILSELKGLRKDNTGYDLKSLFLGAEGTLGIITAAVLKLVPLPMSRQTAWLAVPTPAAACNVLRQMQRRSGERVVSAEYISRASLELVLDLVAGTRDPLDRPFPHYLLIEVAGGESGQHLRRTVEAAFEAGVAQGDIKDGVLADSGRQRDELWRLRESIPEAERHAGGSVKHDISVRVSAVPRFIEEARRCLDALGPSRVSVFGHLGDGNLHFNLRPPPDAKLAEFAAGPAVEMTAAVHDLAMRLGGSFSAEHGVGVLKREELERYASPVALRTMRALKNALDPKGIMNPGKVLGG